MRGWWPASIALSVTACASSQNARLAVQAGCVAIQIANGPAGQLCRSAAELAIAEQPSGCSSTALSAAQQYSDRGDLALAQRVLLAGGCELSKFLAGQPAVLESTARDGGRHAGDQGRDASGAPIGLCGRGSAQPDEETIVLAATLGCSAELAALLSEAPDDVVEQAAPKAALAAGKNHALSQGTLDEIAGSISRERARRRASARAETATAAVARDR